MAARSNSRAAAAPTQAPSATLSAGNSLAVPPKAVTQNSATRVNVSRVVTKPKPEPIPDHVRREMIAQAAYLRSEQRGFAPGFDTEDWLAAEAEVDALLRERYL